MSDPKPEVQAFLDPPRLRKLLLDAVEIYSPSYAEGPVAELFGARLEDAGLIVERQDVAPGPGGGRRFNLLARLGPQPPAMLWLGHLDTIEATAGFTAPQVEGGLLRGLGAADMKGGCAAMAEAFIALHQSRLPLAKGLCLGLVVGEEEYGDGALALLDKVRAPLVIVGEPTGLQPCIAHNGYAECQLTVRGSQAHAAVPEFGANAIHAMLTWLLAIAEEFQAPGRVPRVAANPREIHGGSPLFVVPAACQALVDVHWHPDVDPQAVFDGVERARLSASGNHPQCRLSSEVTFFSPGFANGPGEARLAPFWKALRETGLPSEPGVFRSHSDAGLFQREGCLTVVCGPGKLEMAHSLDERVDLAQVEQAARFYAALAREALSRA